eukprot:5512153-Pleurochrysis_carterae.AAC.1
MRNINQKHDQRIAFLIFSCIDGYEQTGIFATASSRSARQPRSRHGAHAARQRHVGCCCVTLTLFVNSLALFVIILHSSQFCQNSVGTLREHILHSSPYLLHSSSGGFCTLREFGRRDAA